MPSRSPAVKWAQRSDRLFITINVQDLADEAVSLNSGLLTFRGASGADAAAVKYELDLKLFAPVKPDDPETKWAKTGRELKLSIVKQEEVFWPRVSESTEKLHYLKVDFDRWVDEDDEDDEDAAGAFDFSQLGGGMDFSSLGGGDDDHSDSDDEDLPALEGEVGESDAADDVD